MRAADLQPETPPPAWLLHKAAPADATVALRKAVGLAHAAGVLEVVCWTPSGGLLVRLRDHTRAYLYPSQAIPALLARAIARVDPLATWNGGERTWLALLDAMEDLAALVPWWEVAS